MFPPSADHQAHYDSNSKYENKTTIMNKPFHRPNPHMSPGSASDPQPGRVTSSGVKRFFAAAANADPSRMFHQAGRRCNSCHVSPAP